MSAGRTEPGRKRVRRLRHRTYEVLEQAMPGDRLAQFVHAFLMVWIVASVAAVVLESVPSLRSEYEPEFLTVEILSILIFTVEYGLRVWAAVDYPPYRLQAPWRARLRFALTGGAIVDLLTIVPFYVSRLVEGDFRVFIVFRLIRFLKLARYSPGMRSLYEAVYEERRALAACLVILSGLVIGAASVMHLVERTAQPDKFGTIPDAMWWAVVTLATVGYGDAVPITVLGKIVASATALMGLVMLALPVGIIATAFSEVIHRRDFVVTWGMIARVPLFSDLGAEEVAQIMRLLRSQMSEPGEIIVRRGDVGHAMYFIASGQVEIDLPNGQHALLGDGQFFGEMAVLKSTRRSATVRSLVRTQLLVLDARELRLLMASRPDIGARIHEVARARAEAQMARTPVEAREQSRPQAAVEPKTDESHEDEPPGEEPAAAATHQGGAPAGVGEPGGDAPVAARRESAASSAVSAKPEGQKRPAKPVIPHIELPPLPDFSDEGSDGAPYRDRPGRGGPRRRR
jgi:voltage-gated potassium channel